MIPVETRSQERHDAIIVEILYAVIGPAVALAAATGVVLFVASWLGLHGQHWTAVGMTLFGCGALTTAAWMTAILWRARRRGL